MQEPPSSFPPVTPEQREDAAARFHTTQELVLEAKRRLDPTGWDYLVGGSESEATLARNRLALDCLALRPRVLRDVSAVDTSTTLLGHKLRTPVIVAPVGGLTIFDPAGAVAVARAAASRGTLVFHSSTTLPEIDTTAPYADGRLILQLYVRGDATWIDEYAARAASCGSRALCLTVDTPTLSRRERSMVNRFTGDGGRHRVMTNTGREHQAKLNWTDVARLRKTSSLPLILKGIATAEDALLAVEHGVAAIYISNHGGRQLDHALGTMDILPEIINAVRGRAEIIVDGGFVRGTDVLKAMALGANAVGIGKLTGWALAAAGEVGVGRMLDILEEEIAKDMMLLGVTRIAEIDRTYVQTARPVALPGAMSAFPYVDPSGNRRP
jgi:isopentenyl diphosphate isomerase/L-lactate dehydrogenase-like FMN-dependent dehydrogenase